MKRALVLENDPVCTVVAEQLLRFVGYTLIVAKRSTKGARAACLARFELYLIDVGVQATEIGGEGDGLSFARWLRAYRPTARIVVWSGADRSREAAELGAAFVLKDERARANLLEAIR